jgi:hypothetical protein
MGTHEYFLSMLQHLVQDENPCNSKLVKHPIFTWYFGHSEIYNSLQEVLHSGEDCNNLLSASHCNLRAGKAVRKKLTHLNGHMRL